MPDEGRFFPLLDPRVVAASRGVALRLGRVVKSPHNPLFGEDRPWESSGDNLYPNVLFDERERRFRLWYTPFLDRTAHHAQTLCYAESDDGVSWTKPELGLWEFRGSKANNILLPFVTGAGVALDAHAATTDERFKLTYLVHPKLAPDWARELTAAGWPLSKRGVGVGFSADGIRWRLRPDNPVLPGIAGDTHNNWLRDPASGKFVLLTRANVAAADGKVRSCRTWKEGRSVIIESDRERVVKRWESDDFLHWGNGQIVFRAEGDEVGRRHFYSMPSFRHGDGWLGLLALFNISAADDTVDCELAWSPDTVQWQRLCRGEAFIPRGPAGSLDGGCVYAGWSPVLVGDQLRIFYGGSVGTHSAGLDRRSSLCLATLPRDRYAGLAAEGEGEVELRELECDGPRLFVNADASRGLVQAEVRLANGSPADGLGFGDCLPFHGDSVRGEIAWEGNRDLAAWVGGKIRLALRLVNAAVYTVSCGNR